MKTVKELGRVGGQVFGGEDGGSILARYRVRELSGLDPMQSEDRERLGLGLKAYRIIAPRLPK